MDVFINCSVTLLIKYFPQSSCENDKFCVRFLVGKLAFKYHVNCIKIYMPYSVVLKVICHHSRSTTFGVSVFGLHFFHNLSCQSLMLC